METFELKSILEIDAVLETSDLDKCCRASLLNTEQENFNIIEKIVYDLAMNYFHEKNIIYNKDDYYIEFWCKSNGNWNIFNSGWTIYQDWKSCNRSDSPDDSAALRVVAQFHCRLWYRLPEVKPNCQCNYLSNQHFR